MDKLTVGILAHVDAGKTTLSEGMLYLSGAIRQLGRVDHRDAFLDTDALERERGITIFSKQAVLSLPGVELFLLDTPGHVDFSAEMERTLQVLDCAILVISGTDGVQAHTHTLWRLLERYHIPAFLFVNKMDLAGADRDALLANLQRQLSDCCLDFTRPDGSAFYESAALCGEDAMEEYLSDGAVSPATLRSLIARRALFPCWFGSALKLDGVEAFLSGLAQYAPRPTRPSVFSARVFKITRDSQGARLTWMKITGGSLKVKSLLSGGSGEGRWEEKADQIRIYSGSKFTPAESVSAGAVCAVTGLTHTRPGQGLGDAEEAPAPELESVLTYQLILPPDCDPHTALPKMRLLEEEDPQLHLVWNEALGELHLQLMGQVQLEVLQRLVLERFGWQISFGPGNIVYKETIAAPVEGVGHFEPLRHYAEVHLLLEPLPRGSGVELASACSTDALDLNWQRLILTHLAERSHPGVLTGGALTDVRITLLSGRAHLKHTEGGDFRQATYRAVRQGLMQAENILLEPWYSFRLELPAEQLGRAMSDIQRLGGEHAAPEQEGSLVVLTGEGPVSGLRDYGQEVAAYTRGRGRLSCALAGYRPCRDQAAVAAASGYDPLRDAANPPGSVFCSHGAGVQIPWDQVPQHMHLPFAWQDQRPAGQPAPDAPPDRPAAYSNSLESDRELQAIFERTYGKVERSAFRPQPKPARTSLDDEKYTVRAKDTGPEYLLVDGYNIIHAWDDLAALAREDLAAARKALMDILSNYQGFRKCEVILVFDAYRVSGGTGSVTRYHNIHVVYTKEAETADNYIEKVTLEIGRKHRVRVATSDYLEQLIILGHGALRISARMFREEVELAEGQIARIIQESNRRSGLGRQLKDTLKPDRP